jgi:hypothetical protein
MRLDFFKQIVEEGRAVAEITQLKLKISQYEAILRKIHLSCEINDLEIHEAYQPRILFKLCCS